MKYKKKEILNIIKANHRQRIQIQTELPNEDKITYDCTIADWIDEMELLEWTALSEYYAKYFQIEQETEEFKKSMQPIHKKTLQDFCVFISQKATKPNIQPIRLFGRSCREAAIFRYLKGKLVEEDSKAQTIQPSSKLRAYMDNCSFTIIGEVNRIHPQILPDLRYEPNELEQQTWKVVVSGFAILLLASLLGDNWFLGGIGIGLLISGCWMERIGRKIPANKFEFEGLETFRDLVEKIKTY